MMTPLDISTVQAFLLVAELQSFTRAAEALGTTQAAVSMKRAQGYEAARSAWSATRPPQRPSWPGSSRVVQAIHAVMLQLPGGWAENGG